MKVKRAFSIDEDVSEFLSMQKNSSAYLNHIVRMHMMSINNSLSKEKMQLLETVWSELYANLEARICKERHNFAKQGYAVSQDLITTVYTIVNKLGYNLTEDECREYLTMKMTI